MSFVFFKNYFHLPFYEVSLSSMISKVPIKFKNVLLNFFIDFSWHFNLHFIKQGALIFFSFIVLPFLLKCSLPIYTFYFLFVSNYSVGCLMCFLVNFCLGNIFLSLTLFITFQREERTKIIIIILIYDFINYYFIFIWTCCNYEFHIMYRQFELCW